MNRSKPTIKIYIDNKEELLLREVMAGMEEEGVPYEVEEWKDLDFPSLCYEASRSSILGVGIGVKKSQFGILISPLPKEYIMFETVNPTAKEARMLGMNAGRAVKKLPFKYKMSI
jgi:hypothetical protein